MLHGIGGGHDAFAPQLEALPASGFRAVSWDAPGYGHSAPVEPYTFKALAESAIVLIEALIAKTGEQRVVLVGHSMGGMVAQEVAARRPDVLRGLVLVGTSSAFGNPDQPDSAWAKRFVAERTAIIDAGQSMSDMAKALVPRIIGPAASPEGVALAERIMGGVPQATYRRALECLTTFDRRAVLPLVACPTLFVAGEFDRTAPSKLMQAMHQALPHSAFALMKGIGHIQPLEAPEEFTRLLLEFMRRLPSTQ